MYFLTYRFRKTLLDKCLKSPVLEDPSKSNVEDGPKHCWNFNDNSFTIYFDNCEGNSVGKSLS